MQTKQDIEKAFVADLKSLLQKYDACLEAEDHYTGYPECGEDIRMTVYVPGVWDEDGNKLREAVEIDLGQGVWL